MAGWKHPPGDAPMTSCLIETPAIRIEAPATVVWDILVDFARYPEWNPFTVRVESSGLIGEPVIVYIARGHSAKLMRQDFVLETFDPPVQISWRLPKIFHRSLFTAYRIQRVDPLGPGECTYTTSDEFSGLLARRIHRAQGRWVERQFIRVAEALKARAEQLASRPGSMQA